MKKLSLKIIAGLSALAIGIVIVWMSGVVQWLTVEPEKSLSTSATSDIATTTFPTAEESGKVIIRFKGFELTKDWTAKFEITNYTAKPVTYIGFKDKNDFCTLAVYREEIYEPTGVQTTASGTATRSHCLRSKAVILQSIEPNETVTFHFDKNEVQDLVNLREKYKNSKIGFEFFVGDEKRREILWSEDITFPDYTN